METVHSNRYILLIGCFNWKWFADMALIKVTLVARGLNLVWELVIYLAIPWQFVTSVVTEPRAGGRNVTAFSTVTALTASSSSPHSLLPSIQTGRLRFTRGAFDVRFISLFIEVSMSLISGALSMFLCGSTLGREKSQAASTNVKPSWIKPISERRIKPKSHCAGLLFGCNYRAGGV